jgi:hypothetical protein
MVDLLIVLLIAASMGIVGGLLAITLIAGMVFWFGVVNPPVVSRLPDDEP